MIGGSSSPLFAFNATNYGPRRNWRNVLERDRYRLNLQHLREPTTNHNVGYKITEALRRVIRQRLNDVPQIQPHHYVHFTMQSDRFRNAFQSVNFSVREFQEGSDRLDVYLQSLAQKLNSNEEFQPDDSFQVETTVVRLPGRGGGKKKK